MKYDDSRMQEMHDWFRERFVEPEVCDPQESGASGYQYSCGGPYFAREIIPAEFEGIYPSSLISEVVADIETECPEWALRKTAKTGANFFAF